MLVAGLGLGVAVVSVSVAILTGARQEESGMLSGLNSTGHEIGGTIGIAIFSTLAAGATGGSPVPKPRAASRTRSSRPECLRLRQPDRAGRPSECEPVPPGASPQPAGDAVH